MPRVWTDNELADLYNDTAARHSEVIEQIIDAPGAFLLGMDVDTESNTPYVAVWVMDGFMEDFKKVAPASIGKLEVRPHPASELQTRKDINFGPLNPEN